MNVQTYPLLMEAIGRLALLSIMTVAFLIATRRTSLLGFRLLFYFAAGQLLLMIGGGLALPVLGKFLPISTLAHAADTLAILRLSLYALAIGALISLLRSGASKHAQSQLCSAR
jgi:hypothetical protein